MRLELITVDVFTSTALTGNPAAVVFDAGALAPERMQAIAREMNLSETVFVVPPDAGADYGVRIFTPRAELPFAGHPTLATAHAMVSTGRAAPRDGRVVQSCGAGQIEVSVGDGRYTLQAPAPSFEIYDELTDIGNVLGCPVVAAADVDVGITWLVAELASGRHVSDLRPDLGAMDKRGWQVTVYGREAEDPWVRVRSFAPGHGIAEDPVCGSGNACVAGMLWKRGLLPASGRYRAVQGEECGRPGEVFVDVGDGGRARVGGACVTVVEGSIRDS